MSKNVNCMKGLKCPKCGNEEKLLVRAMVWLALTDDGTDPHDDALKMRGDIDWNDLNEMACPECKHEGLLLEFRVGAKKPKKHKQARKPKKLSKRMIRSAFSKCSDIGTIG